MRVVALYKLQSEHARVVEEFAHSFTRLHAGQSMELVDVDSVDGSRLAELYDVVRYPTLLALATDGSLLHDWSGEPLPLMEEVAGYLYQ